MARACAGMTFGALVAACAAQPSAPRVERPERQAPHASQSAHDCGAVEVACSDQHLDFELEQQRVSGPEVPPRLRQAVVASPYQYFRLFASEFSARTCAEFDDVRPQLPIARVHGDAHVLQFVVTQNSYGLEDFDRSGLGPSAIDVVRYAVSLRLACHEARYECLADELVADFLSTVKRSLENPPAPPAEPRVVARLREHVPDGAAWLSWAESLMEPLNPDELAGVQQAGAAFLEQQRRVRPERPASFYDIVRAGRLRMGVGSAIERKLLFRIQGTTAEPADDLILEARATSSRSPCECVWWPDGGLSFQPLLFMSVFGRRMPEVFGYGHYDGGEGRREYWVQAWDRGYRELTLSDIQSQDELSELAQDAAVQLTSPLWTRYPEPLRAHQRYAQLVAFDLVAPRIPRFTRDLADEVLAEWQRFRNQDAPQGAPLAEPGP